MDPRLINLAAAVSLDSWDLENLKFLRKISCSKRQEDNNGENSYCETMSYISNNSDNDNDTSSLPQDNTELNNSCNGNIDIDELLVPSKGKGLLFTTINASVHHHNNNLDDTSSVRSDGTASTAIQLPSSSSEDDDEFDSEETENELEEFTSFCGNQLIRSEAEDNNNNSCDNEDDEELIKEINEITTANNEEEPTSIALTRPLDTCYQLDILTIRNAFVHIPHVKLIPNGINSNSNGKLKLRNGSDGFSSSGESSSGFEEVTGANFFDSGNYLDEDLPGQKRKRIRLSSLSTSTSSSNYSPLSVQSTIISNERNETCPYCDGGIGSKTSNTAPSKKFYYFMGENDRSKTPRTPSPQVNNGDISLTNGTIGDDDPPQLPKTPLPYYVRLRRDLVSNYASGLCPPPNFGVDKQGQLVIDYSQNWIGLEKYIENLKLT